MAENTLYHKTEENKLGCLLKNVMKKKSLSMRKLSQITGISAATISRIISGKYTVSIGHLKLLSEQLDIPLEELLNALDVSCMRHQPPEHALPNILNEILSDLNIDSKNIVPNILAELKKLEQYANTNEGKRRIHQKLFDKVESIDGTGEYIKKIHHLYNIFCCEDTPEEKKTIIGSGLLYFVSTVEVIPDYLFPLGFLDDVIAIKLVEKKLLDMDYIDRQ